MHVHPLPSCITKMDAYSQKTQTPCWMMAIITMEVWSCCMSGMCLLEMMIADMSMTHITVAICSITLFLLEQTSCKAVC